MRESKIERTVCRWAKDKGCIVIKQTSAGNRGIPDRLFLRNGKCLFLEFKAPGKKPTKLQLKWMSDLWLNQTPAFACDDIETGKHLIIQYLL